MNDMMFPQDPRQESLLAGDSLPQETIPRFGAVDIVEAFTAMRHEWRGQTKESRALAEQIQAAAANLQSLESKLVDLAANNQPPNAPDAKRLVMLIVETDHQFSRAVASIAQGEANESRREAAEKDAIDNCIAGMSRLGRWFARPLLTLLAGQLSARGGAETSPAVDGLNIVLERLRRAMREHGIERQDVLGQLFDANTMHAIGVVASTNCPAGFVAEQLSPAYRWQGQLVRFADVRVAGVQRTS